MIESVRHKALRAYPVTGRKHGLHAHWMSRLRRILTVLKAAEKPEGMNYPGSRFHALKGGRVGRYSVRLTANVRATFGWGDDGATDVDIEDYTDDRETPFHRARASGGDPTGGGSPCARHEQDGNGRHLGNIPAGLL